MPVFFGIMLGATSLWNFLYRKPMRRRIRLELIKAGQPVCMQCTYDLRGLLEPRCPECGTPFDLSKPPYAEAERS